MDAFELQQPRMAEATCDGAPSRGSPGAASSVPLVTRDEYDAYVEELARLQTHADQEVIAARIRRLEELARTARIVDGDLAPHVVALGRSVQVEHLLTGKIATYRLAGVPGPAGSDTVSAGSPVGAALMGRSPGDVVAIDLPHGRTAELRVLAVLEEKQAA